MDKSPGRPLRARAFCQTPRSINRGFPRFCWSFKFPGSWWVRQTPKLPYEKYQKTGVFGRAACRTGRAGRSSWLHGMWKIKVGFSPFYFARGLDFRIQEDYINRTQLELQEIERMIWTGYLDYLYHWSGQWSSSLYTSYSLLFYNSPNSQTPQMNSCLMIRGAEPGCPAGPGLLLLWHGKVIHKIIELDVDLNLDS